MPFAVRFPFRSGSDSFWLEPGPALYPQPPALTHWSHVAAAVMHMPMFSPSLTNFLLTFFNIFLPPLAPQQPTRDTLSLRLRHFHAVTPSAEVYFADVPSHPSLHADATPFSIPISPVRTVRPQSAAAFAQARALSMRGQSAALDWDEEEIPGPDVSKRETLLLLAKMTSNAYVEPNTDGWYNLTDEWGVVRRLYISYRVV